MLCAHRLAVVDSVAKARKYWAEKNIPADSDGQVMRVGQKFALVAAVGELAIVSGILPWPVGEAEEACVRLFSDWLAARGGTQAHEGKDAEKNLKAFISEHGSARFEASWQDEAKNGVVDRKTIQRAGFKRMTDAETWEYFILPPVFEKEVIGSLNKSLVKGYLAQRGLIIRDAGGKHTISMRVPGVGQVRLYHIPASILDGEGDHVDA
jgi:putative DNA primase/helicase